VRGDRDELAEVGGARNVAGRQARTNPRNASA
jgi:hypothetical protein